MRVVIKKLQEPKKTIVLTILFLLVSTLVAWYITKKVVDRETEKIFLGQVDTAESWILDRFENYSTILYSIRAFWNSSEEVTSAEWEIYVRSLKTEDRLPGVTSVVFIQKQAGLQPEYSISYIYPPERGSAIGFDAAVVPRLVSVEKAIDTNSLAVSDKLFLAADSDPGFVMYLPLYQTSVVPDTLEGRRAQTRGLAAIALKSESVFAGLFDKTDPFPFMDFELYKGNSTNEGNLLYDHDPTYYIGKETGKNLTNKRSLFLNGETFTLLSANKHFLGLGRIERNLPRVVLTSGFGFVVLISAYAFNQINKVSGDKKG